MDGKGVHHIATTKENQNDLLDNFENIYWPCVILKNSSDGAMINILKDMCLVSVSEFKYDVYKKVGITNFNFYTDDGYYWSEENNIAIKVTDVTDLRMILKEMQLHYGNDHAILCDIKTGYIYTLIELVNYFEQRFHIEIKDYPKKALNHNTYLEQDKLDILYSILLFHNNIYDTWVIDHVKRSMLNKDCFIEDYKEIFNFIRKESFHISMYYICLIPYMNKKNAESFRVEIKRLFGDSKVLIFFDHFFDITFNAEFTNTFYSDHYDYLNFFKAFTDIVSPTSVLLKDFFNRLKRALKANQETPINIELYRRLYGNLE